MIKGSLLMSLPSVIVFTFFPFNNIIVLPRHDDGDGQQQKRKEQTMHCEPIHGKLKYFTLL